MWILAVDVRDGQRIAFPQWMSGVSMDVKSYQEDVQFRMEKLRRTRPLAVEDAITTMHMSALDRVGPKESDEMFTFIADQVKSQREALDSESYRQLEMKSRLLKAEMAAEAIIYFNGSTWPVRDISQTTSWDHMTAWVGRSKPISTADEDLPDLNA